MLAHKTVVVRHTAYHLVGKLLAPRLHKVHNSSYIDKTPRPSTLLMKGKRNLIVVEVGFGTGDNALSIMQELDVKQLVCIDWVFAQVPYKDGELWISKYACDSHLAKINMRKLHDTGKVLFIKEDSQVAHKHIKVLSADLVYVDGGHSHEVVINDLVNFYPKVKRKGLLAGHDFIRGQDGVIRAVGEFSLARGLPYVVEQPDFIFRKV